MIALAVSITFFALGLFVDEAKSGISWFAHGLVLCIIYVILTWEELRNEKPFVNAILPIIILRIISDLTELINSDFHDEWESYFGTAELFAFIWMFAMWFVTNRQRKALEKERLKALEKEKEYKITEVLKAELEVQVAERTAALTQQKSELEQTISELRATQAQLIQSEKMASLGELTAGIAHEIQNPLNFVNNFSELNRELIEELQQELKAGHIDDAISISNDIKANEAKIDHHGKRADAIVKGMLQHSRSSSGMKEPTDINALCDEYLRLAYHGLRAKDNSFNAILNTDFDKSIEQVNIIPQDIGRVVLNLIMNAFYAVNEKSSHAKATADKKYEPTVSVVTKRNSDKILIAVKDNGIGIPQKVLDKIFQPFFTTKPTGQGTGLGLSLSYDIIKAHGGEIRVNTKENEGTEFAITLPA